MEQIIQLTGRIAKVFPAMSGTSKRTGEKWMAQEYLLEYHAWSGTQYVNSIVFRVLGEDKINQWQLKEWEDNITVTLTFLAREYNERYYNEVRATNVQRQAAQQAAPQPAPQPAVQDPVVQQQAPAAAPPPQAAEAQQAAPQAAGGGQDDDNLPF